ncbi:DNA-binding transcriptional LysR family regulator [Rahnella sp. BIGb0603]|jgi:DNA-binding transcriptional LysR family regulator|uniref:LysR family transcriptional regulator n=1 Tax=Rahnella TaxID=34037 RepID=UPI001265DFC9|nr:MULTISPECIES: LysR family transcriptional regulator [Rahnella]KAB8309288.1 LysR family transcriptional regulator [Rouxiella chamberiensis]MCS3422780.1 DNA-binding transcriptional LysR family regulator [Rahnella sp. BIGb0603]MDF1894209.1 LysR family transcriptional regulator [Rahnella contaminans]
MSALRYSFSQIEAFACVAGSGSLSKAALLLGKDRTTVRDLLDYLEDALGYTLFVRQGRTLILTEQGQQLHRQAHLLLRQAQAFESYAQSLPDAERQELVMVYDPFVSPAFIEAVIVEMAKKGLCFSAWSASREEAEAALKSGKAQVAVCQANYRALGTDMEWRALGNIGLDFYASAQLFQHQQRPLTLLNLSLIPQVVMHKAHDEQITRSLQISGQTLYVNERSTLRYLLENAQGWGFLPTHFQASRWKTVQAMECEVGNQGLDITMVAIWQPGAAKQRVTGALIDALPSLWREAMGARAS